MRLQHILVHDVSQLGFIGIHQKILDCYHAFQMALLVHHITGIDGLLVHTVLPDIGKGLLYRHILLQAHIFGGHHASCTVFRVI